MKRIKIFVLALLAAAATSVTAQPSADTVNAQHPRYYTSHWFDECHAFQLDSVYMYWVEHTDAFYSVCKGIRSEMIFVQSPQELAEHGSTPRLIMSIDSTQRRMPIIGMTALVIADTVESNVKPSRYSRLDTIYQPEWMILYTKDPVSGKAVYVDSARWDTVKPHPVALPRCVSALESDDYDLFMHFKGYDVYFDRPHVVDGAYYLAGTANSNEPIPQYGPFYYTVWYACKGLPLFYGIAIERVSWCIDCGYTSTIAFADGPLTDSIEVHVDSMHHAVIGPFLPIIDTASYMLTVATSDSAAGSAYGSGVFRTMTETQIYAEANEGYRFTAWSDGNADNPRTVEVYWDTLLTALFDRAESIATADDAPWDITVTPNPTRTEINVAVEQQGIYELSLLDIDGHTVHECSLSGNAVCINMAHLPAGSYILVVGSGEYTVRRTIIKQ